MSAPPPLDVPSEGAPSYWRATGRMGGAGRPLDGPLKVEVAIVGGGLTGLSAAHHLAGRGVSCAVLEANTIGWGASGASAGFFVLRYKRGFARLAAEHGLSDARRLHALVLEALGNFDEVVERYRLDPYVSRCGHLTAGHAAAACGGLAADVEWLKREANDNSVRMLDRRETADALGTDVYLGSYFDPRGGAIHPLDYVRGLATGLEARGVPILTHAPVTQIREDPSGVSLECPSGTVRAERAIFATNAYTNLAGSPGDLARRIVPVSSSLIVTEVIPEPLRAGVLPCGAPVTDTKRLLNAFRLLPDGRLLVAGRGDLTGRSQFASSYRPLERALVATFPNLAGVATAFRWSGKVALPADTLPHVGALSARLFYSLGCIGRGVLITHLLGRYVARLAVGERVEAGPITSAPFRPVPFHRFRHSGMRAMATYYGLRDRLDRRSG